MKLSVYRTENGLNGTHWFTNSQCALFLSWVLTVTNEWKRRNNKKKNSAEGRERATVHSVLECETVATFLHFTSI